MLSGKVSTAGTMQPRRSGTEYRWVQKGILTVVIAGAMILSFVSALMLARDYVRKPQAQQWELLSSPFDGTINALLVEDPNGVRVMYAGTEGGVFKSEDQGEHWAACNQGLADRLVRSLAMDPDNPNTLYAGTWSGKVFITENGGGNWEERSGGLPRSEIRALAVHTYLPERLYALTPRDIFISTDRGRQWHAASDVIQEALDWEALGLAGTLQCMAMDPEHPNTLYVGTTSVVKETGVYISTDAGLTWHSLHTAVTRSGVPTPFRNVAALAMSSRAPGTVYAIGDADRKGKVLKTQSAGVSWDYVDSFHDDAVARCVALNPKNPQEVYVGLTNGIYKSVDGRQSWSRSDVGPQGPNGWDVRALAVDPLDTNVVYACADNQLFISEDAGHTWALRYTIQANHQANILALKADPKNGEAFYASVDGGGLYKTEDRGEHWQHVGEPLPAKQIAAIEVDPVNPRIVYAGHVVGDQGFVSRSTDGGLTWPVSQTVLVAPAPIRVIVVDPELPRRIYVGTQGYGLFRSDDGGQTWTYQGADIGKDVRQIVVNPKESPAAIYVLTEKDIVKSQHAGEEWESRNSSVVWVGMAPPVKSSLKPVLISAMGVVDPQAHDDVIIMSQPDVTQGTKLVTMSTGPAMPEALFSLAQGKGVLRKAYSGEPWITLGTGLESLQLRALALSPDDPDLILVGTERGIYRYQADKSSWQGFQDKWRSLQRQAKSRLERLGQRITRLLR